MFVSNSRIGSILDLYNSKFFEDRDFYINLAECMRIDMFLIMMFLRNSKSEIRKIISKVLTPIYYLCKINSLTSVKTNVQK